MKYHKCVSGFLVVLLAVCQFFMLLPSYSREFSKAGQIFHTVQDGVVTVFTSAGHGSGFLVDGTGIVLTNSHVVKEGGGDLRVKFGPKEIVKAMVIINDRENDIAVLRVNLKNITSYKALSIFTPENEDLVQVGEQVIAIGSPIERTTLEKMMTLGVVGKFDKNIIYHDASINPGNSGGPLFNFDGQVVGINTFITVKPGQAIAGAVPISLALKDIETAKHELATAVAPSDELLPDIPEVPFPISQLLKDNPDIFKNRKQRDYNFDSEYFSVSVLTPPQGYYQLVKMQDKILERRNKRAEKKHFSISDDEYDYKNLSYYDYKKPVVTVWVIPKPKLTTGSKVLNTITFLTATTATVATFGAGAPLMILPFVMGKHEYKKDFLQMSLVTEDNQPIGVPIETGRIPFERAIASMTGYSYAGLVDKSYCGRYTFDARCFETDKALKLVVNVEGEDKNRTIKFPDSVKKLIAEDFKPYWSYVANLNPTDAQKKSLVHATSLSGHDL